MNERSCTFLDPQMQERCTECGVTIDLCVCVNINDSAHERLASPDGLVITMVRGELAAARKQVMGSTHMLAALTRQVGGLAQAMIDHDQAQAKSAVEVLREAVQVAAIAIRVATEGDDNFLYQFPREEEELPRGPVSDRF